MAKVVAVCRSDRKGTTKEVIDAGFLKRDYGLEGDAHADSASHRQVSLLAMESIAKMQGLGLELGPGDFAENITTDGIDLILPVGTRLAVGTDVVLEITQIGKECHAGCAIFQQVGKCIMPQEGVFAQVVKSGPVRAGDEITIKDGSDDG